MRKAIQDIDAATDNAISRHAETRAEHTATDQMHAKVQDLHKQLRGALDVGNLQGAKTLMGSVDSAMQDARGSHGIVATKHDQVARSLDAVKLAVAGADTDEGYSEPTSDTESQGGTFGSGPGRITKSFTPEAIRERDQRRGIEAGYLAKIRAMQGR